MSTKRKIIIFALGLVLILFLFYLALFAGRSGRSGPTSPGDLVGILEELSKRPVTEDSTLVVVEEAVESQTLRNRQERLAPVSAAKQAEQQLELRVARFIERWGSFSNQGDFGIQRALATEMSISMQRTIPDYISAILQAHPYQGGYYGFSTKAVTVSINNFSLAASRLTAQVETRRLETINQTSREFNQLAEVELVKQGDMWLVDSVKWSEAN